MGVHIYEPTLTMTLTPPQEVAQALGNPAPLPRGEECPWGVQTPPPHTRGSAISSSKGLSGGSGPPPPPGSYRIVSYIPSLLENTTH